MENANEIIEKFNNALSNNPNFIVKGGKIYAFMKRCFDISASLLALILLSPLFIIIGFLVLITSKGPIIYKSVRVTTRGKFF